MTERLGFDEETERELYLVTVADIADFDAGGLPGGHSIALVAAATHGLSEAEIHRFAAKLLDAGAVYVCCWGPGCERMHDLIDDAILFRQSPVDESAIVMTTWHSDEPLDDALSFALVSAMPSEDYDATCRAVVAVCVGEPAWAERVRTAFQDSAAFKR